MKYKKIMFMLVLAIFIFGAASVCASDVNDTVIASEDTGQTELSAGNENEIVEKASNEEVISEANVGTFQELQQNITQGYESGYITLDKDYEYEDGFSTDGITITQGILIDGQGHKIDAKGKARIFNIKTDNVALQNITFMNGKSTDGGAIKWNANLGSVLDCHFENNTATGDGGAIHWKNRGEAPSVNLNLILGCSFVNNTANYNYGGGGAVYFDGEKYTATVEDCNFKDNSAPNGGAVYFLEGYDTATVSNCNFTDNKAGGDGGAIWMYSGSVENCNFANNTATYEGGAIRFSSTGTVSNCNFTNNSARYGGAIWIYSGSVSNCNFVNDSATGEDSWGGAIRMYSGTVSNCNFTGNTANDDGGAVFFNNNGNVTNCNFADNSASRGGAILSVPYLGVTVDTCIFKTDSDTTFNTRNLPPTLNVDNFTTVYGSGEKLTFDLKTNSSIPVTNGNISISVYFKDNGVWVRNYTCLSGEGWIPDLPVGSYIAFFYTEYAEFQEINRTVTITMPNVRYSINVSSVTTNNKTVNITAKSDIPKDILWDGKLLFILPNNLEINATYGGNGTWWAVHTFDDYGVYQVNASYAGLTNVTITNATITINKLNSTVDINDVVLTYGETKNVTVTTEGATGITAKINGNDVTVINNYTIVISGLAAGNYTLTVTTIPDGDHNSVNKTVNVTVNKAHTEITINTTSLELFVGDETIILATLFPDGAGNVTFTSSNKDIVEVDDKGNIIAQGKGQAIITVSFAGDNNYTAAENKTVTINVSLADASVTVDKSNVDLKIGETYAINATKHPDTILLDITYKSSNNAVATVDKNGIVTAVGEGTAIITVEVGDDILYAINSTNVTVTVNRIATGIASSAVTTVYNIEKNLIVTLKDADGKPISGAKITVDLNGAKTYTTDNNGQVKVSTKGLAAKTYTAKITFNGNEKYKQSTKDVKVTVKKATPKLTAKKKTFKTKTKTKKYTITLKDNTGKAMKKVKVTLKVKGKTYKATTNSKGKATFKIKNLKKKGTFKAVITYKGDKNYNKVTKKVKIKVIVTFKTVSQGSKDKATVKDIQRALKDHGYYLTYDGHYLMIDGKYNSCTVRSIKEFQNDKGLKVTGKVDEKTAHKLGLI